MTLFLRVNRRRSDPQLRTACRPCHVEPHHMQRRPRCRASPHATTPALQPTGHCVAKLRTARRTPCHVELHHDCDCDNAHAAAYASRYAARHAMSSVTMHSETTPARCCLVRAIAFLPGGRRHGINTGRYIQHTRLYGTAALVRVLLLTLHTGEFCTEKVSELIRTCWHVRIISRQ